MNDVPGALLWTHAAYWVLAVLTVWLVRRLRVRVERVAQQLEVLQHRFIESKGTEPR